MGAWWEGVAQDLADVPDAAQVLRLLVRLLAAAVLGGLLGAERGRAGKEAGMRTHMLVALGAALFVLIPGQSGMLLGDLSRVILGVAAGIGFLGAGTILKLTGEQRVRGLTTSAGIWLTAAVGLAAGLGRLGSAVLGTTLALLILTLLGRVEWWLGLREGRPASEKSGKDLQRQGDKVRR